MKADNTDMEVANSAKINQINYDKWVCNNQIDPTHAGIAMVSQNLKFSMFCILPQNLAHPLLKLGISFIAQWINASDLDLFL